MAPTPTAPTPTATPSAAAPAKSGGGWLGALAGVVVLGLFAAVGAGAAYWWLLRPVTATPIEDTVAQADPQPLGTPTAEQPGQDDPTVEGTPVEDGSAEGTPVADGAAEDGAAEDAPAEDGAAEDGAAEDGAAEDAAAEDAAAEDADAEDADAEDADAEDAAAVAATEPTATPLDPQAARDASDVHVSAARDHMRTGDRDAARAAYLRAVEVYDANPRAHAALAELALAERDPATALPHAERAASLRRRRAEYQILLGDARSAAGDNPGARRAWARALDMEPNNTDAQRRLGE